MDPPRPITSTKTQPLEAESLERTRTEALVHLLGDDDAKIRSTVWDHLEQIGAAVVPVVSRAVVESADPLVRAQAEKFLLEWRRREVFHEWVVFCKATDVDLEAGALLIARTEYPEIDTGSVGDTLDEYAGVLRRRVATARSTDSAVKALVDLLHGELGFRGNVEDYYDADNSYLNRVIERRIGIPITLSAVHLLVARRLSIPLEPVGLSFHFLLKFETSAGRGRSERFVDPFHGGDLLSSRECAKFLRANGVSFREMQLKSISDRAMLSRMLGNLLQIYHRKADQRRLNRITAMLKLLED
jgi:regulator of sirC expression with transglutaminase-like and TPR domain